MNDAGYAQIQLILDDLRESYEIAFKKRVALTYRVQAAAGRLQPGSTVNDALRYAEIWAAKFVEAAVDRVGAVSKNATAFAKISDTVGTYFEFLTTELEAVVGTASGNPAALSVNNALRTSTQTGLDSIRETQTRRLEIHRFSFVEAPGAAELTQQEGPPSSPKKGGRPAAAFWDEMWASIAVMLYDGKLFPKSQSDIEKAMTEWIESEGHSAAVSTIRERARRLWDRLLLIEK